MGHPVPFLLAPQEAKPITAIIAITANKIFFFIVKFCFIQGFNRRKDTNLHYQH